MPLNDFGRVQAEEAGARLRRLVPASEDLDYVASPLGRARETMELMRQAMGLPSKEYRTDERFIELTFGDWEGLTWKEVRARDANAATARTRDKWAFAPPGGESYAMLAERIAPAVAELTRDVVIVSHGGVARVLLHLLCKMPRHQAPIADIWQGKVLVFRSNGYAWA